MNDKVSFQLEHSNIPDVFANLTFDNLNEVHPELIKICKLFIHNYPANDFKGLYLYSAIPGNAKSSLAALMLRGIIEKGKIKRKATFISFPNLIMFLRKKYVYNGEFSLMDDYESIIERSELLVIDDIGKEIVDKSLACYYFSIINKIYEKQIPTIYTSNSSIKSLCKKFEGESEVVDSVLSRIESMCKVIHLTNRDYRII